MYVWRRLPEEIKIAKQGKRGNEIIHERKKISDNKIEELAKILNQNH